MDEEVLETGPGRVLPRSAAVALGLVAVAAVAVVVTAQHDDPASPRAARPSATSTPTVPNRPVPIPEVVTPAAVANGSTIYTVRDGSLVGRKIGMIATTSVSLVGAGESGGRYRMVIDRKRARLWITHSVSALITIFAFDLRRERELRRLSIRGEAAGADIADGELYISTDEGVVGIASPRDDLLDWLPLPAGRTVAADPGRHRVLLLEQRGAAVRIVAVSPDLTRSGAPSHLALSHVGLAVVGGRIWVAGDGRRSAALLRLDPQTLRAVAHSPLETRLGRGARIVATGSRSLFVRARGDDRALWCVDSRSGAVQQWWPDAPGTPVVVSAAGPGARRSVIALVSADGSPQALAAETCPG